MPETPANILPYDSDNPVSLTFGFQIHQWHDTAEPPPHDHIEREATGDGWISYVVRLSDGEKRGPYAFTGAAREAMKAWAKESGVKLDLVHSSDQPQDASDITRVEPPKPIEE